MADISVKPLRRGWILAALMMTMALAAMDNTIVATAIPQIVGDLGGFSKFGWLFSIYLLVQTITIPIYGKLSDIHGRKSVLVVGVSIFLVGSASCAAAWDMYSLIAFRALQGFGAGGVLATVNTVAGDIYTVRERAKIQGWLSSVWGISAILGPAIGGALVDYASWRWIFLINIPIGIAAISFVVLFFHEHQSPKAHSIDWRGAFLMMFSGTALLFVLLQGGQAWAWFSYQTLAFSALAVFAILLTSRFESSSQEPILPGWVWKNRIILGANLATIGFGIAMMGPNMFLPVFAQSVTGVGAMSAGFILASMSITWPIFSALSGTLYLRIGFRNTALCGVSIVILTATSFSFISFPGQIWSLVAIQMLLGAGFGLMSTPLLVGVQSMVGWERRGVATSTVIFSRYFGQSLGAAIFGAVFNTTLSTRISSAPAELQSKLPSVNKVIEVLQTHHSLPEVGGQLRHMFFDATHHVYSGVLIVSLISLVVLLLTPSILPKPNPPLKNQNQNS